MRDRGEKMKRYLVENRITKEKWKGEAGSAQEACERLGWLIGDCWVLVETAVGSERWKNPQSGGRRVRS